MNAPGRPNIVWISTHDIGPHLGSYAGVVPGAEYASTPNLDRLAAEGVRYDRAYASAPVCAPSRSAIVTGYFPTAVGTMHMRTKAVPPVEVRLLPDLLREAGYFTTSTEFTDYQVQTPLTSFDVFGAGAHWRDRPTADTPFFAMFHGMTTHESQIYLDEDAFLTRTADVPDRLRHDPAEAPLPPYYPDNDVFRTAWARYSDLITQMDHEVGVLLDQLQEDGLADDTIVVFWSDHGLGLPRGKRWAYESGLHEPLIVRWPGAIPAGTARDELVHLMDLTPTMLTVAGVPVPDALHASTFLEADGSFAAPANEYVFGGRDRMDESEDCSRTVRDARFRYILHEHPDRSPMLHIEYPDHLATWTELRRLHFAEASQLAVGARPDLLTPLQRTLVAAAKPAAEELYDLDADPHETVNLATEPGYEGDLMRLRRALTEWRTTYADLALRPEAELLEQWRPGGVTPTTTAPIVAASADGTVLTCETPGAGIVWTTTPPAPSPRTTPETAGLARVSGAPRVDGRSWRLYRPGTTVLPTTVPVWTQAWRLGYEPSDVVELVPSPRRDDVLSVPS